MAATPVSSQWLSAAWAARSGSTANVDLRDGSGVPAMLDLLPARAISGSAESPIFCTFADIARQFDALGVAKPASLGREDDLFTFRRGITSLMIPGPVGSYGLIPEWEEINGYPVTAIDRAMGARVGPGSAVVLDGEFDAARVRDTLMGHGFVPAGVGDTEVLSLDDATLGPGRSIPQPLVRSGALCRGDR